MAKKTRGKIKNLFYSKLNEAKVLADYYDYDFDKLLCGEIEEMNLLEIDNMRELELFKLVVSTYSNNISEFLHDGSKCNRNYNECSYACDILNYLIGYREADLKGL